MFCGGGQAPALRGRSAAYRRGGYHPPETSGRTPSTYISERCGSEKRSRVNATFPPRKDAKSSSRGGRCVIFPAPPAREPQGERRTPRSEKSQIFPGTAKEVLKPWFQRAFFPSFVALDKRWSSKTGQAIDTAGSIVSVSDVIFSVI